MDSFEKYKSFDYLTKKKLIKTQLNISQFKTNLKISQVIIYETHIFS